ncbi:MAG: hypothetical protein Q8R82_01785, partial [Hyphomonadaceae bacterium]|nr:hypothetical protein [Hyphomonadaceae bacterium]
MTFKVRLLLGAAAPFMFALPAVAQVSISTARTTPLETATANSGAASNVDITSAGSVTLTAAAANSTAVTINSNNSVTNAGTISTVNSSGTVAVRIAPGITGNFTSTASVSAIEDYTRTDTDADGDLDGPLAQGTNRIGVLVESGGAMTGNLALGGTVSVEGNNSYGVSVRSQLNGNYTQSGTVSLTGSNGIAIDIREDVTGNVRLGGTTGAQGEGSIGARILGNVAGEFLVDGGISSTGYTSTSVSNYADPDDLDEDDPTIAERRDADDLLIGGAGLEIRGDLGRGLLINGAATGTVDPTEDVKDVIQDFNENRNNGSVNSYGSAPAVLIQSVDGGAGDAIVLSRVRETILDTLDDDDDDNLTEVIGVFNYDYGFVNRGAISGNGLNVGVSATGLRIAGSADSTHSTTIEGGIFNGGSITAQAAEANAIALHFGAGATTPLLLNTGTISAGVATETNHDATAMLVDVGANLPAVTNSGLMSAQARGYDGDAVAFRDLSGTVANFTNTSRITSGYVDNDSTDTITSGLGRAIALDLSHSGSGVTLTQNDTIDNTRIFGDVLFGVGNDQFNLLSGEVYGDVDFGTGSDTLTANSAKLFGDANFGGSSATVSLNGAIMEGSLSLGAATGSLNFTNQSSYIGDITRTGAGAMTLAVNNSTVNN